MMAQASQMARVEQEKIAGKQVEKIRRVLILEQRTLSEPRKHVSRHNFVHLS